VRTLTLVQFRGNMEKCFIPPGLASAEKLSADEQRAGGSPGREGINFNGKFPVAITRISGGSLEEALCKFYDNLSA
jgi:hypothetical protein